MGIGGGWYEHEWEAYGYGFPSAGVRLGMLDEGVQIMREAWRKGEVSFNGKHYQVDGAIVEPKPLQDGGLPLWIAGGGEKVTLRIAAKYAAVHELHFRARGLRAQVACARRSLPQRRIDYGAIVRSANFNAVVGESEADVKETGRTRARQAGRQGQRGRRRPHAGARSTSPDSASGTPEQSSRS
jgi:alkanesulfonate monooxygenase SsuD/methylene tetrahydromethanopterin reductase-like flavin-dependent oxidoreductase (luciferase family)